ncbi:MAG: PA0069 family radical SAM protein [Pseudomonadota bacterium]
MPRRDGGRGARSNLAGRYEPFQRSAVDDGWTVNDCEGSEEPPPPLRTHMTVERPKSIINYVDSPFVSFDRSINPYRGCEHGCIYCFARPTHAYYGLSPGLDFEQKLFAKPDAADLLRKELSARKYKPAPIAIGTNTDPYQPAERSYQIMRGILKVLTEFNHPVSILTKSALIERDVDLLAPMAEKGLVKAMVSITSLDRYLSRTMEPRASTPEKRLKAVTHLAQAGIPTGVMTAPVIPGLNDHEIEGLVEVIKQAGAQFAGYTIVRLPLEVAGLFQEWLETAFPDRARRVLNHIRDMNGGRIYDPKWSRAEEPRSTVAKLIDQRFTAACRRHNLSTDIPILNAAGFQRPVEKTPQLSLFSESD